MHVSSDKPTLLLAHGAWHPPHLFEPLRQALTKHDYKLVVPALPTMGVDATRVGWDADVKVLLEHQSYEAVIQPVDFAVPDITILKTYVICERDNAFPTALQHQLSSSLGFENVTVSGGHALWLPCPQEYESFVCLPEQLLPLRNLSVP